MNFTAKKANGFHNFVVTGVPKCRICIMGLDKDQPRTEHCPEGKVVLVNEEIEGRATFLKHNLNFPEGFRVHIRGIGEDGYSNISEAFDIDGERLEQANFAYYSPVQYTVGDLLTRKEARKRLGYDSSDPMKHHRMYVTFVFAFLLSFVVGVIVAALHYTEGLSQWM